MWTPGIPNPFGAVSNNEILTERTVRGETRTYTQLSEPRPRLRIEPPILVPVPRNSGESSESALTALSNLVHPPEPTMDTRSVRPAAAPRQNNAIPRISGVPNDPSSKKKRVIRKPVSKPRRPNNAVQARAPAPNPALQITPETLGLKSTTDMNFHPADPAPIPQTGTSDRTYIQL